MLSRFNSYTQQQLTGTENEVQLRLISTGLQEYSCKYCHTPWPLSQIKVCGTPSSAFGQVIDEQLLLQVLWRVPQPLALDEPIFAAF